jgi:sugar phosphate isomerase/epimerase
VRPQFGIFARTFTRQSPEQVAAAVADAGYQTTQLNISSFGYPTVPAPGEEPDYPRVADAFSAAGVEIWGLSATFNAIDPDVRRRERFIQNARMLIGNAPILGAGIVTLCTGTRDRTDMWLAHPDNTSTDAWADLRATLDRLIPAAAEAGAVLSIEPELGNVIRNTAAAQRLITELGNDAGYIGIVLDPANLLASRKPDAQSRILTEAFSELSSYVVAVHAKDVIGDGRHTTAGPDGLDYRLIARLHQEFCPSVPIIVQDSTEDDAARIPELLAQHWTDTAYR